MIRYAIPKPEPLRDRAPQLRRRRPGRHRRAGRDARGGPRHGPHRRGDARLGGHRRHRQDPVTATVKVAVVGPGQDRPAARGAVRGARTPRDRRGRRRRRRAARSDDAVPPFPGERDLAERLSEVVRSGALEATTDTAVRGLRERRGGRRRAALRRRRGQPGVLRARRGDVGRRRRSAPRHARVVRDDAAGGHHAQPARRRRSRRAAVCGSERTCSSRSARSGSRPAGCSPTSRRYPKLVGGVDPESGRRAVAFYGAGLRFDERPDLARPNGVWDLGSAEAAELAKLAETTYRDVNIGLANQFALLRRPRRGRLPPRSIEACNSQPFSHLHRPGSRSAGTASPSTRGSTSSGRPRRDDRARSARGQRRDARASGADGSPTTYGDLRGATVVVLGACYRGGVKETAFSGVFGVGRRAARARRGAVRARPAVRRRPSSRRSGSSPTGTASGSTPRSCRPTTRSTAASRPPTCPV